jgi:sulfur carrier protein
MAMLTVTINGDSRDITAQTMAELVAQLRLDIRQIAVEHNGAIIARSGFAGCALQNGDVLELVSFIGGG